MEKIIYVFTGQGSNFPAGIFTDITLAIQWIEKYSLSGILSSYPTNIGLYDWAIESNYFEPQKDYQKESKFIERFTSASLEHLHFENGKMD